MNKTARRRRVGLCECDKGNTIPANDGHSFSRPPRRFWWTTPPPPNLKNTPRPGDDSAPPLLPPCHPRTLSVGRTGVWVVGGLDNLHAQTKQPTKQVFFSFLPPHKKKIVPQGRNPPFLPFSKQQACKYDNLHTDQKTKRFFFSLTPLDRRRTKTATAAPAPRARWVGSAPHPPPPPPPRATRSTACAASRRRVNPAGRCDGVCLPRTQQRSRI